jgi:hypothetical protein
MGKSANPEITYRSSETYVYVGFGRSAQVATYADRQQPMQTLVACGSKGRHTAW